MAHFFYSAQQRASGDRYDEENGEPKRSTLAKIQGKIVEYTEMDSSPNPNESMTLPSGTVIKPHKERFPDSVYLGEGEFNHTEFR